MVFMTLEVIAVPGIRVVPLHAATTTTVTSSQLKCVVLVDNLHYLKEMIYTMIVTNAIPTAWVSLIPTGLTATIMVCVYLNATLFPLNVSSTQKTSVYQCSVLR